MSKLPKTPFTAQWVKDRASLSQLVGAIQGRFLEFARLQRRDDGKITSHLKNLSLAEIPPLLEEIVNVGDYPFFLYLFERCHFLGYYQTLCTILTLPWSSGPL